jgi:hypothetical protein
VVAEPSDQPPQGDTARAAPRKERSRPCRVRFARASLVLATGTASAVTLASTTLTGPAHAATVRPWKRPPEPRIRRERIRHTAGQETRYPPVRRRPRPRTGPTRDEPLSPTTPTPEPEGFSRGGDVHERHQLVGQFLAVAGRGVGRDRAEGHSLAQIGHAQVAVVGDKQAGHVHPAPGPSLAAAPHPLEDDGVGDEAAAVLGGHLGRLAAGGAARPGHRRTAIGDGPPLRIRPQRSGLQPGDETDHPAKRDKYRCFAVKVKRRPGSDGPVVRLVRGRGGRRPARGHRRGGRDRSGASHLAVLSDGRKITSPTA